VEKLLAVLATSAVGCFSPDEGRDKRKPKMTFVRMCLPFAQSLLRMYIDFGFALIGVRQFPPCPSQSSTPFRTTIKRHQNSLSTPTILE